MKRSSIPAALLTLLTLIIASLAVGQGPRNGAAARPDHITLTWTEDPATTMTVTWRTDSSVAKGLVEYQAGDVISTGAKQAEADMRDFATDLGASRLFTSTLAELSPNTRYSYRVGDGENWSGIRSFQTADPETHAFKFLIFGDSQDPVLGKSPYEPWRITVQNAYRANPDARFMINVGDLVEFGQRGAHWNAWFDAAVGVIDRIPEMPVSGNHESYGSFDTKRPEYWAAQFALPQNGPDRLKSQVYSFNYGPVHFVMLDSQQKEQKDYGDIIKIQQEWLEADLAASRAEWNLVFFHKPPYEIKARRKNEDIKAGFCPIIEKHHADLVFNGHDHGIARTFPIHGGVSMERPSQGTVYYIVGQSGGKTYGDIAKKAYDAYFYNPLDQPNYLVVEVRYDKITVKALLQDGTLLDTFFIDKAEDTSSDMPVKFKPPQHSRETAAVEELR